MLLRNGGSWAEFAELAREVFVLVARADYGIAGRPTNTSRVALITGLSRREVTRIKAVLVGERSREEPVPGRISQILSAWHIDPQFLDASGRPALLKADGAGASVPELLRRYAGDMPHVAVLKELRELGLVRQETDGFRVLARDYIRSAADPDLMRQGAIALHDHAQTVTFNVDAARVGPPRFERMVTHRALPRRHLQDFEVFVAAEGQALLERVDEWLLAHAAHAPAEGGSGTRTVRAGLGMYLIRD